jgi:hypothetical protein
MQLFRVSDYAKYRWLRATDGLAPNATTEVPPTQTFEWMRLDLRGARNPLNLEFSWTEA